jgi:RimJ/RimL family protein N-acetyltransferase
VLRPFTRDDIAAVTAACQDPEIPRWTVVPAPYTEEHAREWIAAQPAELAEGRGAPFAVSDAATGALLGSAGLVGVDWDQRVGEVGYWVARDARRRGVATRAVRLVSRWAFDALGMERMELLTDPANVASQGVAERAGYTREGLLRAYRVYKGGPADLVMFSLLPGDPS